MNTPDNIKKFNKIAGKTLSILYESFPIRINVSCNEHYGLIDMTSIEYECQSDGKDAEERTFICSTLAWLSDAGYINATRIDLNGATDAVLTAKGLEVMNLVPETIGGKKNELTVAGILREGLKAGEAKAVAEGLSWLFRKGLEFVPIIVHSLSAG